MQSVVTETHQAWHDHRCFGPFAFYDIAGKESNPQGSASIQNNAEAHMVLCVFRELMHRCEGGGTQPVVQDNAEAHMVLLRYQGLCSTM